VAVRAHPPEQRLRPRHGTHAGTCVIAPALFTEMCSLLVSEFVLN
jgi:hypothetical protein